MNMIIGSVLLITMLCSPAQACFGPKLFVGVGPGVQDEALYALVTLYVQEKTGVESTRFAIETGQDPLALLADNKVDLMFVLLDSHDNAVFQIAGLPLLTTGKRPLEDLQFTTVLPAIRKLNRLLKREDVEQLIKRIESGDSAMSAARKFLMERRWI